VKNLNLIKELQHQGTWRLVILSIVTLTVYWAHYIARQSKIINTVVSDKEKISKEFIVVLFVLSYFSLSMTFIEALLLIDSVRDSFVASSVAFHTMLYDLGFKTALVPFIAASRYWRTLTEQVNEARPGAVDRLYLQV